MLVLQANTIAIVALAVLLAIVLFVLLKPKKKAGSTTDGGARPESDAEAPKPPAQLRSVPSKETFAPLPAKVDAAPAPLVKAEPEPTTAEKAVEPVVAEAPLAASAESVAAETIADANVAVATKGESAVLPADVDMASPTARAEPAAVAAVETTVDAKPVVVPAKTQPEIMAEPGKGAPEKRKAETKPAAETKKAEPKAKAETKPAAETKKAEPKAKVETKPAAETKKAEPKAKAETKKAESTAKAAKAKADDVPWELRDDGDDDKPAPKAKAPVTAEVDDAAEPPKTLKDGLGRTRKEGFIAKLSSLFKRGKAIDDDLMDEVEEVLFTADIGVKTADRLMSRVRAALNSKELKDVDKVWSVLRDEGHAILAGPAASGPIVPATGPQVIMVLGVNGTGKTTTIGKLANRFRSEGKKVLLVAGDTFRAAAAEQLEHWGRRVGVEVFRGKEAQDPASVVFDGVRKGLEDTVDIILVDTAGRLHNNTNLMEELKKVRRVMGRAIDGAPHEVLLVLDATTGQNAVVQARQFKDATEVTGIVLTKLDGTAKGGVVLGVSDELKIPVRWVGVGERVADIRAFDAREFVDELFQPPS